MKHNISRRYKILIRIILKKKSNMTFYLLKRDFFLIFHVKIWKLWKCPLKIREIYLQFRILISNPSCYYSDKKCSVTRVTKQFWAILLKVQKRKKKNVRIKYIMLSANRIKFFSYQNARFTSSIFQNWYIFRSPRKKKKNNLIQCFPIVSQQDLDTHARLFAWKFYFINS